MDKSLHDIIERALLEDIGRGDITTDATIDQGRRGSARIIAKQEAVIAGMVVADQVFRNIDGQLRIKKNFMPGDRVTAGTVVMNLSGRVASMLKAERVALNFLGHLSGVATLTAYFVKLIKGTKAKITDTRKTMPLLRVMEKEAVVAGGGVNHRMGLYDLVLIKQNHIRAAGSIKKAVEQTRHFMIQTGISAKVEVEASELKDVKDALLSGVDRIMLTNMDTVQMHAAVKLIDGAAEVVATGEVHSKNIREIAETGVDYISVDSITNSVPSMEFSLLID